MQLRIWRCTLGFQADADWSRRVASRVGTRHKLLRLAICNLQGIGWSSDCTEHKRISSSKPTTLSQQKLQHLQLWLNTGRFEGFGNDAAPMDLVQQPHSFCMGKLVLWQLDYYHCEWLQSGEFHSFQSGGYQQSTAPGFAVQLPHWYHPSAAVQPASSGLSWCFLQWSAVWCCS